MDLLKRAARLAFCLPFVGLVLLGLSPRAHAMNAAGNFGIEQVYVNVPELDVFVRAADSTGKALSPSMVRAAGVELRLGDTLLDTGNIQTANEAICYIFVLDNYADIDARTFRHFKNAIVRLNQHKADRDQIAIYGMDSTGALQCLLPAATDRTTINRAARGVSPDADRPLDMAAAAGRIYEDIDSDFQSLAPRKVVVAMTDAVTLLGNLPLLATMESDMAGQLNMGFYLLAAADEEVEEELLAQFAGGHLLTCPTGGIEDTLLEALDTLPGVLEFKTAIDPGFFGERWETLTLAVPAMGSAITASTTVYMGHQLTHPAVAQVTATGRRELTVTFNQAVSEATAGLPSSYLLQSEDVWGFRLPVRAVTVSEDGYSAVLTTGDDLYAGPYSVRLRNVAAALSSANTSDATAEVLFSIDAWPRDRGFYLARLRIPAFVLAAALLVLVLLAFGRSRRERAAEQAAEVEHLLSGAVDVASTPHRFLTLFIQPPGAIAESRWAAMVESSLLIGSDAGQCELCVADARMAPQHCMLSLDGDAVLLQPLGKARVYVNGQRLAGIHHLLGDDTIKIGRTQLRVVL